MLEVLSGGENPAKPSAKPANAGDDSVQAPATPAAAAESEEKKEKKPKKKFMFSIAG